LAVAPHYRRFGIKPAATAPGINAIYEDEEEVEEFMLVVFN